MRITYRDSDGRYRGWFNSEAAEGDWASDFPQDIPIKTVDGKQVIYWVPGVAYVNGGYLAHWVDPNGGRPYDRWVDDFHDEGVFRLRNGLWVKTTNSVAGAQGVIIEPGEAVSWLERYAPYSDILEKFTGDGEAVDPGPRGPGRPSLGDGDGPTPVRSMVIPDPYWEQLGLLATRAGTSRAEMVRRAIAAYLDTHPASPAPDGEQS